ncbi:uncharacterized protein RCC_02312 [Ramularia collo-cygni]|uniref:Uncharacterized protein n=1 Tax=Ramularia collo-cygni TaxID=112498 RepID=A0A2D3V4Q5_9PEZI|nr:uncharacterized protein RCC_02312 [Ramularia collo-cygni]CZT16469.1 uncharacterized protein RCC_02312 [Ramularia collo-cygni]
MVLSSSILSKSVYLSSMESLYGVVLITLAVVGWSWYRANNPRALPSLQVKNLWTSAEILDNFTPRSWQRNAYDAFSARLLMQQPQIFPCVYAAKGFKAREHRFCFIDPLMFEPGSSKLDAQYTSLSASFDEYAQNWRNMGPMTSLVVLTPLSSQEVTQKTRTLRDDRSLFWQLLREISDRDPSEWPEHVPEEIKEGAWTLRFRGEAFVALALSPQYEKRQSRFCAGFVLAFQPIAIFKALSSSPEKWSDATGKVRALTDSLDHVPYSEDVIAVGNGEKSVGAMFFLSDDEQSWGSTYSKIRSG